MATAMMDLSSNVKNVYEMIESMEESLHVRSYSFKSDYDRALEEIEVEFRSEESEHENSALVKAKERIKSEFERSKASIFFYSS